MSFSGNVCLSKDNIRQLNKAAEMLEIPQLQQLCEDHVQQLNAEEAAGRRLFSPSALLHSCLKQIVGKLFLIMHLSSTWEKLLVKLESLTCMETQTEEALLKFASGEETTLCDEDNDDPHPDLTAHDANIETWRTEDGESTDKANLGTAKYYQSYV